jgi:histidyl-tRNA synthetase
MKGSNDLKLISLAGVLSYSKIGLKGIEELQYIFDYVEKIGLRDCRVELDLTLARGLNYYTGAIFEVKAKGVEMGSICGGGRYDDLTGIFGLPGVSGVGISFGADRIYDVMTELNLFPEGAAGITQVLFANFGVSEELFCMKMLREIRSAGIRAEMYPENVKMKKQFKYADDKKIPWVAVVGTDEMEKGIVSLKNMQSGDQYQLNVNELIELVKG